MPSQRSIEAAMRIVNELDRDDSEPRSSELVAQMLSDSAERLPNGMQDLAAALLAILGTATTLLAAASGVSRPQVIEVLGNVVAGERR